MIIEIKGVEFENKGSHLMLLAIIRQIRLWWPSAEFALTHSAKASPEQRITAAKFRKLNLRKNYIDISRLSYFFPSVLRRFLKSLGLVTESDVDMIIDASGFSYSDQWQPKLRIYHLKNELTRFYLYSKPYIFLPQAFGPFTDKISQRRITNSFKYAALICARERESLAHIQDLTGPLECLHEYNDFTNLTEGVIPGALDRGKMWACIVPNNNMIKSQNVNKTWIKRYESILAEAVSYYREKGLIPFFLNHEGKKDAELIDRVNSYFDDPVPVVDGLHPLLVKGLIGASEAVFSSRYHGCVSALSQGIACIGTSWSHKYELLYRQYDATDLLLGPTTSEQKLRLAIDASLEKDSSIGRSIEVNAIGLKNRSGVMWSHFKIVAERYATFRGEREL
jgi:colanic acid/amylovoran biosynthesis protein